MATARKQLERISKTNMCRIKDIGFCCRSVGLICRQTKLIFLCFFFFFLPQSWEMISDMPPATWWWPPVSQRCWSACLHVVTPSPPCPGNATTSESAPGMTASLWVQHEHWAKQISLPKRNRLTSWTCRVQPSSRQVTLRILIKVHWSKSVWVHELETNLLK